MSLTPQQPPSPAGGRTAPVALPPRRPRDKKSILLSSLPPLEKLLVLYLRLYGKKTSDGWERSLSRRRLGELLSSSLSAVSSTVRNLEQRGLLRVQANRDPKEGHKANTLCLRKLAMEELVQEPRKTSYSDHYLRKLQRWQAAYERGLEDAENEWRKRYRKPKKRRKHQPRPCRVNCPLGSPAARALVTLGEQGGECPEAFLRKVGADYGRAIGCPSASPENLSPDQCLGWWQTSRGQPRRG